VGGVQLTLFDVLVLVIVGVSAVAALARGAVAEIMGLLSWVGATVVAFAALPYLVPLVQPVIAGEELANGVALVGVFVVTLIVLKLLTGMIVSAVSGSALGPLDRLLGLVFGAARGVVLVCAAYLVGSYLIKPELQPDWVRQAYLVEPVRAGSALLEGLLPERYRHGGFDRTIPKLEAQSPGLGYTDQQRQAVDKLVTGKP
jgi:membrane protein required for colicin V production